MNACKAIFKEEACLNLVQAQKRLFKDSWFSLLFTKDFICSYLVPVCGDTLAYEALSVEDYAVALLQTKPEKIGQDEYLDAIYKQINEENEQNWALPKTYNVLTLSDWHVDLAYKVGSVRKGCNNFVCCHEKSGLAETPTEGARRFGELTGCDLPMETAKL